VNRSELQNMHLWYDYPYQRSNLVHRYLHWCFFMPFSPTETRTFYSARAPVLFAGCDLIVTALVFLWGPITVAGIPLPNIIRPPLLHLTHKFYLGPLLGQVRALSGYSLFCCCYICVILVALSVFVLWLVLKDCTGSVCAGGRAAAS
jgi:hypothetical protein